MIVVMNRTGHADLPLHGGTVPKWLAERMKTLGGLIVESLVYNYGKREVLSRLSDPLWFQSLGAVLGMDWHSSGITTSVMYALKRSVNPHARELGVCICGGRGVYSRRTPDELRFLADATGLDGDTLVRASKLCAKVDNTAVQDGFQLYQHNFIVTDDGDWAVVQQGMNPLTKTARRYHWCSPSVTSFVEEPHAGIVGENRGTILNLTDRRSRPARDAITDMARERPDRLVAEIRLMQRCRDIVPAEREADPMQPELFPVAGAAAVRTGAVSPFTAAPLLAPAPVSDISGSYRSIVLPARHEVTAADVDLKRLGAVLSTAYENGTENFESLLLTKGLGPRTLQSLALVSEVVYGAPARFTDPARFSFAHGGKDGHPFPVPCRIYDESIRVLRGCIEQSKLGLTDKNECLRRLHTTALQIESNCDPEADFSRTVAYERAHSAEWDGRIAGSC